MLSSCGRQPQFPTSAAPAADPAVPHPQQPDPERLDDLAELKSAVDGLNAAAAKAKDAKVRDALSALADDYRQILDAVAAGQPGTDRPG